MSDIRDLYQEVIIDHARRPRNFGMMDSPSLQQDGFNPLCGDKVTVYLKTHDDRIDAMQFQGCGCAISMASASLLSQAIVGKTLAEVEKLFTDFQSLLTSDQEHGNDEQLGKLAILKGVRNYPARVKCAMLVWHTVIAALAGAQQTVTTE